MKHIPARFPNFDAENVLVQARLRRVYSASQLYYLRQRTVSCAVCVSLEGTSKSTNLRLRTCRDKHKHCAPRLPHNYSQIRALTLQVLIKLLLVMRNPCPTPFGWLTQLVTYPRNREVASTELLLSSNKVLRHIKAVAPEIPVPS